MNIVDALSDTEARRLALVAQADEKHRDWPQFAHAWDDWQLATINRRVYRHGKLFADKGDDVLVSPERDQFYSWRVMVNVAVDAQRLEM